MPCVSLLLCLCDTVLVTALPLPPQAMLKAPAMILGVKGPSNQHCIGGGGGGMREFAVFLQKCPKTFGQDCRFLNRFLFSEEKSHIVDSRI